MSISTAERVAIRFAARADNTRWAEIDEATWSPRIGFGPRPISKEFFRARVAAEEIDGVFIARWLDR